MGTEFCESRLTDMNLYISVFVCNTIKIYSQELVGITHEVNLNVFLEKGLEEFLLEGIGGV